MSTTLGRCNVCSRPATEREPLCPTHYSYGAEIAAQVRAGRDVFEGGTSFPEDDEGPIPWGSEKYEAGKNGHRRVAIDLGEVSRMSASGMKGDQIAAVLGVSRQTLVARLGEAGLSLVDLRKGRTG